jgi:Protein of unknown function (DUF3015).
MWTWLVFFKENSILSSSLRVTTNGILFPFTTLGMTFGTSNCTKHKLVKTQERSLYYVTQNFYELKAQMAQGGGQFIDAYAEVIGCQSQDFPYFKKKIQEHYHQFFQKGENPREVLKQTYHLILGDHRLVNSCSLS